MTASLESTKRSGPPSLPRKRKLGRLTGKGRLKKLDLEEDGEQLEEQLLLLLLSLHLVDGLVLQSIGQKRLDLNKLLALEKAEALEKAKEKARLELIMALLQCLMDKCKCMTLLLNVVLSDWTSVLIAGRLATGKIIVQTSLLLMGLGLSETGMTGIPARMPSKANSTRNTSDCLPGCQT